MNGEVLQRIVETIVSRLQRRAHSTATLSVAQLRDADCRSLFCQHASLRVLLVDLPLLNQLAEADTDDAAVGNIHDALAFGIRVQLTLHGQLLPVIPVKKLARLPLTLPMNAGCRWFCTQVRCSAIATSRRWARGAWLSTANAS